MKTTSDWLHISSSETKTYVYHYTSADKFVCKILPTNKLRLGPFRGANDPVESQDWPFGIHSSGDDNSFDQRLKSTYTEALLFKNCCNFVSFSSDESTGKPHDASGRGFVIAPMWAHYAERNTGVCLVFDRDRIVSIVHATLEGRGVTVYDGFVEYLSRINMADESYELNDDKVVKIGFVEYFHRHLDTFKQPLLFTKLDSWRYEREFRIVAVAKKPTEFFIPIQDALSGVVLGNDFDLGLFKGPHIKSLMRSSFEHLSMLQWSGPCPWYLDIDFDKL